MTLLPRLHHVQVLCPPEGESQARWFFGTLLGLPEIPRPPTLERGGVWFALACGCELHIGVSRDGDEPSRSRAHFALEFDELDEAIRRLREANVPLVDATQIAGISRIYAFDPFGNRVELMRRVEAHANDPGLGR